MFSDCSHSLFAHVTGSVNGGVRIFTSPPRRNARPAVIINHTIGCWVVEITHTQHDESITHEQRILDAKRRWIKEQPRLDWVYANEQSKASNPGPKRDANTSLLLLLRMAMMMSLCRLTSRGSLSPASLLAYIFFLFPGKIQCSDRFFSHLLRREQPSLVWYWRIDSIPLHPETRT